MLLAPARERLGEGVTGESLNAISIADQMPSGF